LHLDFAVIKKEGLLTLIWVWRAFQWSFGLGMLSLLISCSPQEDSVVVGGVDIKDEQQVVEYLWGTWSRRYVEENLLIDKTLTLQSSGQFVEHVSIKPPDSPPEEHEHTGTWLYDGTNIKRTYLLVDGHPPSRLNLPFVTFEVKIESKNEFVGIDHIHHHEIRYIRVPD